MENKTWTKLIVAILLVAAVTAVILYRWILIRPGPNPIAGWERGGLTASVQAYYSGRINRIIETWQSTRGTAAFDRNGLFKESYTALLVIDSVTNTVTALSKTFM